MNPISTDDQLPDAHNFILWWHPRTRDWRIGLFRTRGDRHAPGFFQGEGAWYVEDGPTWWMPTLPDPTVNQGLHASEACAREKEVREMKDEEKGRCGNCTLWTREQLGPWGSCSNRKITGTSLFRNGPGPDGLVFWNSDGSSRDFFTGEDFGCVHFVTVPPDLTVNKWKAIAQARIDEHGTVTAEEVRELNEPYKEAIIAASTDDELACVCGEPDAGYCPQCDGPQATSAGGEVGELKKVAKNKDKANKAMANRWSDTADDYPAPLFTVLKMSVKHSALEYIDANCPEAWFRPIFVG